MRRRLLAVQVMAIAVLLSACAVRNAPQLTSGTVRDLQMAYQLTQANKDYTTFFTDVGDARRSGALSNAQVVSLNGIGGRIKTILEQANATFKTYQATKDQTAFQQTAAYLVQVSDLLNNLIVTRTQMLTSGGA